MKTREIKKTKSTVEKLRDIRDKVSMDIQDMTFEELKKYLDKRLTLHPKSVWHKAQ
jgi:hypothetical protein